MTNEEQIVWSVISKLPGKENAMPSRLISQATKISEREVRNIFRSLRLTHGKLIGSTLSGGYFICSSLEELKECFATALNYENHNRENRQFFEEAMKTVEEGNSQLSLI